MFGQSNGIGILFVRLVVDNWGCFKDIGEKKDRKNVGELEIENLFKLKHLFLKK